MSSTPNAVIDLFSGVGGLSLGAARAGFSLALAVEKDSHIIEAHKKNFHGCKHLQGNLMEFSGNKLLEEAGISKKELAGVIGGPPCQGFSYIGRRCAKDSRNLLFIRFFELVAEMNPCFFMAENVPGIMEDSHEHIRKSAYALVPNFNILSPIRVKASDYGAPTKRERYFFIGVRKDLNVLLEEGDFMPSLSIQKIDVKTALKGLPTTIKDTWKTEELGWRCVRTQSNSYFWDRIQGNIPQGMGEKEALEKYENGRVSGCLGTKHGKETSGRYAKLGAGAQDKISKSTRLRLNDYCPTLRAGTGPDKGSYQAVRPIHPTEPRVITPREAARLQGFPDWFRFDASKWHSFRMIGNSVSPLVSEILLRTIKNKIETKNTPVSRKVIYDQLASLTR